MRRIFLPSSPLSIQIKTKSNLFLPYGYRRKALAAPQSSFCSSTTTNKLSNNDDVVETDVLIVGGGVVGCALARSLLELSKCPDKAPIKVGLVEAGPGSDRFGGKGSSSSDDNRALPHPRSYALSPASLQLLGMNKEKNSQLGYYQSMQVWEANQPASLVFTEKDLENGNNELPPYLGAVVEDSVISESLWSDILQYKKDDNLLHIWNNTNVSKMQLPEASHAGPSTVVLQPNSSKNQHASSNSKEGETKANNTTVHTKLLVAADGGNSWVRQQAGIATRGYDYGQTALTFTVELAQPHRGRAFQRFLSSSSSSSSGGDNNSNSAGTNCQPLALLPTFSKRHAVVVWSTTPDLVQRWKDHPDLVQYLNKVLQEGPERLTPLFQESCGNADTSLLSHLQTAANKVIETVQYGPAMAGSEMGGRPWLAPPLVTKVTSPQFTFPLQCRIATRYTDSRLALVGDACHTVHPLAGQGLNLGLQDVRDLVDCIGQAAASGMDVTTLLHSQYERNRQLQVGLTVGGIHAVHTLFGQNHVVAKHIKSLGMNAIQNLPPFRQTLVQAACQGVVVAENSNNNTKHQQQQQSQ